ncbi:unnamed protein product [Trichobilharzia szidati]|nr:unnamed protein product [Trichobilharzia szidati]
MALVNYGSSGEDSSDDGEKSIEDGDGSKVTESNVSKDRVEPEFKMRVPKSAKIPNLVPNIPIVKTKEGKIFLSVPDLEALDSSDDSEEDGQSVKTNKLRRNYKSEKDKVNLLSILPPTRALIIREGNKPMIPHQLIMSRKITNQSNKEASTVKSKGENDEKKSHSTLSDAADADEIWDSDAFDKQHDSDTEFSELNEDAEESSFFSFYTPAPENHEAVASARAAAISALRTGRRKAELSSGKTPAKNAENDHSRNNNNNSSITAELSHEIFLGEKHTPKSWEDCLPKVTISDTEILRQMSSTQKNASDEDEESVDKVFWSEENFIPGPERKRARLTMPGTKANNIAVNELLQSTNTEVISINQSDLTAGAQLELIKSVTGDDAQYRPKPTTTTDEPGKLAHRKHQITWLCHQAQENELELEKRWAEARRNKASNRAKYGF